MTPEEFREQVRERTDTQLLETCLHDDAAPYVFDPHPDGWDLFRDELAKQLSVSRSDVRIVGSARFGFSMKPGRNLRTFTEESDIDVVIVNNELFDRLWFALLEAAYPRERIAAIMGGWLKTRRNELYTGWLTPLEITLDVKIFGPRARPVLDFNTLWFNALKQASRHPSRRHEDVNGRLYRTWRHANLYHLHSLAALRRSLA